MKRGLKPTDLEVGQEVILRDVNERRLGAPVVGTVVKIGRKLVTIEGGYQARQYRLEDQSENNGYGHRWFETLEQREEAARRDADREVINGAGFDIKRWQGPTDETIAKVAECLRAEGLAQ